MVELKDIAKKFEDILNTNTLGKTFRIFSDSGELAKRNGHENEYRNGLVEIVSSTISNLSGLEFISSSVNLTLYANEEVRGKNSDGNSIEIIELRQILCDFLDSYNFKTFAEEFGEITYSTTYVIGATTTLPKGSLGYINDCVPLITNIGLTFFENGVNSNEWQIFIDGEEVGYTSAVISRTKTAENQPLVENKSTKSVMQTNGFGLDLVVPQISNNLGNAIENEILTGQEYAHMLYIKGKNTEQNYICVFGNLQASLIKNSNVGFNVPLVEGVPELLNYKENVWINESKELEGTHNVLLHNINEEELFIFWGDGTYTISSDESIPHTYDDFGSFFISIFNKNAVDDAWAEIDVDLYLITYDLDGGTFDGEYLVSYTSTTPDYTIPEPLKDGYDFNGWTGTDLEEPTVEVIIPLGSTGNKEYTANWDIITYLINYTLNGGSVSGNPVSYDIEDTSITLLNPTKTGYTFTGWSGTGITGTSTSVVIPSGSTGNRAYTANWDIVNYTLTVNLNGGTTEETFPTTYNVTSEPIYLSTGMFTKTHYTCLGVSGTGITGTATQVTIPTGSTGNRAYTVQWQGDQYSMSYDLNGGTLNGPYSTSKKVYYGSSIGTLLAGEVVKTGYMLEGWYIDGNKISSSTAWSWASDKDAVANWIPVP